MTGPINLGNPIEITVAELAHEIIELTDSKSRIEKHPLPADDPCRRCPDITLARHMLGWQAKVGLQAGLRRPIEYFECLRGFASSNAKKKMARFRAGGNVLSAR